MYKSLSGLSSAFTPARRRESGLLSRLGGSKLRSPQGFRRFSPAGVAYARAQDPGSPL